jgi:hypothetical protein
MRVLSASLLLLLAGAAVANAQVKNAELGYTITVPDGFVDHPDGMTGSPDLVSCWIEETPAADAGAVVLCVQRLRGTLGRERMTQADLPEPGMQLANFKWKEFDIQGARAVTEQEDGRVVALVAAVPLKPEAIQLLVAAPESETARAEALMSSTLATLQGESNWLTSTQRAELAGEVFGRCAAVAGAIWFAIWYRRRRRAAAAR